MRDDGVILTSSHRRAYGHDYEGLDQLGRGEECKMCEIPFLEAYLKERPFLDRETNWWK